MRLEALLTTLANPQAGGSCGNHLRKLQDTRLYFHALYHRYASQMLSKELCVWLASITAATSLQSCPTLCNPIDGSPPGSRPWDSPGKSTGVGCHFLLQCMKVKSESEVAQSCPTLSDPMDCCLPGSSVHGIFQARVLEWGAIAFSCFDHC